MRYEPVRPMQFPMLYALMESQPDLQPTLELMGMTLDEFRQALRHVGKVYAIQADGTPVGFYWIELRQRVLQLHALVLEAAYQGQGIGTRVLDMLTTTYAEVADVLQVSVPRSNQRLIALYERLGFNTVRVIDEREFLIMQKAMATSA